jgi:hypothetical protein
MIINILIELLIVATVCGVFYYLVGLLPTPPVPEWVKQVARIILIAGLIIYGLRLVPIILAALGVVLF